MDAVAEAPVLTTNEAIAVSSSPLRAQYDAWAATMADIRAANPGIIVDIISPDRLNNGLTLEQIDSRWNELQKTAEPEMLELYEIWKDYLAMPRIVDTFADSGDGHKERRKFRLRENDRDPQSFDVLKANDWRMGNIAAVLGAVEFYEILNDDSNLEERHAAIFSEITDASDTDRKEIYSRMSKTQKADIATKVRNLAREVFFSAP